MKGCPLRCENKILTLRIFIHYVCMGTFWEPTGRGGIPPSQEEHEGAAEPRCLGKEESQAEEGAVVQQEPLRRLWPADPPSHRRHERPRAAAHPWDPQQSQGRFRRKNIKILFCYAKKYYFRENNRYFRAKIQKLSYLCQTK